MAKVKLEPEEVLHIDGSLIEDGGQIRLETGNTMVKVKLEPEEVPHIDENLIMEGGGQIKLETGTTTTTEVLHIDEDLMEGGGQIKLETGTTMGEVFHNDGSLMEGCGQVKTENRMANILAEVFHMDGSFMEGGGEIKLETGSTIGDVFRNDRSLMAGGGQIKLEAGTTTTEVLHIDGYLREGGFQIKSETGNTMAEVPRIDGNLRKGGGQINLETRNTRAEVIHIDGSLMEGGGQILRNAVTLSCLTGQAITVSKIRGFRSKPGLRPQHLHGIRLVGNICNAALEGDVSGSMQISFTPRTLLGGQYSADTQTAGSVCLITQLSIPCLIFADKSSTVTLRGGTNADLAPPIDFYIGVFKPIAAKFGVNFDCDLVRRGFFPRGRGEIKVTVNPSYTLNSVDLTDFGEITKIYGTAYVAGNFSINVADAMATSARKYLQRFNDIDIDIKILKEDGRRAFGSGCGIIVIAETSSGCILSGDSVGKEGKPEAAGLAAAEMLQACIDSKACVDSHMQDQVIIFMALATGISKVKVGALTLHSQTAIYIAKRLTSATFTVTRLSKDSTLVECNGYGHRSKWWHSY